jgi:RNase P/RNase MRP subunit POP5
METWLAFIIASISLSLSIASILTIVIFIKRMSRRGWVNRTRLGSTSVSSKRLKRYVVFRIIRLDENPSFEELERCLKEAVREGLGLLGYSETSIKLIRYNVESGVGIFKIVSSDIYPTVFLVSRLRRCGEKRFLISPLKITGTMKSAYKKISVYEKKYR